MPSRSYLDGALMQIHPLKREVNGLLYNVYVSHLTINFFFVFKLAR